MAETVMGWDVGGAHLKVARLDASGTVAGVVQLPCQLWRGLDQLDLAVEEARRMVGPAAIHGITMTGEMVDLFPSRRDGVAALVARLGETIPGDLRYYAGRTGFLAADAAVAHPDRVASANWLATASAVASLVRDGLLVDVGSTTIDLIPVVAGAVATASETDSDRLVAGELVYSGLVRTPLMALAHRAPFAGGWTPLMAEYFATTADVYRLTGRLPDGADLHPAADGGEKSVEGSARRLARMIGRDSDSAPHEAWRELAGWFVAEQTAALESACTRVLSRGDLPAEAPMVVAGVGRFLAEEVALRCGRRVIGFASLLPAAAGVESRLSDCAPAAAVGWLVSRLA
jgi:(4-(4-[2-(gamma-L-glutamylamino)ethyl]phenoxymethyl)furan-2-yl)methanamine synthase